jgi:hypothetical protein
MSATKRRELRQVMRLITMIRQANGPYRNGWPRRVPETAPLVGAIRALHESMLRRHPQRAKWAEALVLGEQRYRARGQA